MTGKHRAPKAPRTITPRRLALVGLLASSAATGTVLPETPAAAAPSYEALPPLFQAPVQPEEASSPVTTYTVVPGDWLSTIAPRFGMTWTDLWVGNRDVVGANPNLIYPNQVLTIDGAAAPVSTPQHSAAFQAPLTTMDVTQDFKGDAHRGIDLHADIGTPGYAVAEGTVRFSRPASGFGLWTVISSEVDGEQVDFVYGHMDHLLVAEGDHVNVGDHIIDTGTNGVVSGPHLHFEVWIGGRTAGHAVDPIAWLRDHGVSV